MNRTGLWLLFASLLVLLSGGLSGRASAEASAIATSMGDLRWGMSEREIVAFVKRKLEERYSAQIHATRDSHRQSQLRDELKRAQAEVQQNLVNFESGRSRWDSSVIAGEFDKGNGESMIVYKDDSSENYYFFLNGHLWKWYKALDDSAFGGNNFKRFQQSVEKKFGRGHEKHGELSPGQGQTQWLEYLDRNSRLRAADNTKRGVYALIFEDMATVRELASIRPTAKPSRSTYRDDDDAQPASTTHAEVAKAQTRRSIFANEQHEESDAEYQARQKRLANEERQKQQNIQQRKQEAKKGEVLKPLEHMDDKDPLGGL